MLLGKVGTYHAALDADTERSNSHDLMRMAHVAPWARTLLCARSCSGAVPGVKLAIARRPRGLCGVRLPGVLVRSTMARPGRLARHERKEHRRDSMHGSLKTIAFVVLALLLVAALYAGYMSLVNWHGIGV